MHTGRSAAAEEKPPSGHGPEGWVENGRTASLLVGHVSIQMLPTRASQAAHFERNGVTIICETVH
jgi:hypothetical protein